MNFQANQFEDIARRAKELEQERTGILNSTPIDDDLTVFRIYFASRSRNVSKDQQDVLERAVRMIRGRTDCRIIINGHTDRHGVRNANMNLGAERALAVGAELMERGIPGSTMEFQSFGSTVPRLSHRGDDGDEDRMNRRVEIILG